MTMTEIIEKFKYDLSNIVDLNRSRSFANVVICYPADIFTMIET